MEHVLSIIISLIALSISTFAFFLHRSRMEATLYKNISDSIQKFYDYNTKEFEIKFSPQYSNIIEKKKAIKHFFFMKRLYKIEVMNHLEKACDRFLNGYISDQEFRRYYGTFLSGWSGNVESLKSSKDSKEFESIERAQDVLDNNIELYNPLHNILSMNLFLIVMHITLFVLLLNCVVECNLIQILKV